MFWPIIPLIFIHVQRGKNVFEGEQAQKELVEQVIHDQFQNNEQNLSIEAQQQVQLRHSGRVIRKTTRCLVGRIIPSHRY